jgi:hypothetical protein
MAGRSLGVRLLAELSVILFVIDAVFEFLLTYN